MLTVNEQFVRLQTYRWHLGWDQYVSNISSSGGGGCWESISWSLGFFNGKISGCIRCQFQTFFSFPVTFKIKKRTKSVLFRARVKKKITKLIHTNVIYQTTNHCQIAQIRHFMSYWTVLNHYFLRIIKVPYSVSSSNM